MPSPPVMIGPYRIVARLGRGAMGTVYRAEDTTLGRMVALKLIQFAPGLSEEAERLLRARFQREARAAGSLTHPNIVTVYQAGEHEGREFLAMELVDGAPLSEVLYTKDPERIASREQLMRGLEQVASALDYAHGRGVVHRDVKPANLLVTREGTFKVADFGIAKLHNATELTSTGAIVGTPNYTPPEVLRGQQATAASDQYALGVVAYEVLTRRVPFEAPTTEALFFKILHATPPSVREFNPSLGDAVDTVLARALDKDPLLRFRSCTELVRELGRACEKNPEQQKSPKPAGTRKPLFVPILVGVTIAAMSSIGIWYWIENDAGSAGGYRIPNSVPRVTLPGDLPPAPFVDRVPPAKVDAGFQYPEFPYKVVGPRRPKAHLQFWLAKANDLKLLLLGSDRTLYLTGDGKRIWAVRDRKVLWGFEVDAYRIEANSQGLLQLGDTVLNASGEGGRVRGWSGQLRSLLPRGPESRLGGRTQFCKPGFPLDHECENGAMDASGNAYLLTATKNLYAFDRNRRKLWVTQVPCRAPQLMEFAGDTLVLGCRASRGGIAESLVGIRAGKVAWTFKAEADIDFASNPSHGSFLVDGTGAMYFADTADPVHLYALNRAGQQMWRYNLGRTRVQDLWLDGRGHLFLSHVEWVEGAFGAALTCLADEGC
jgi:serine/threonine protein kinase